MVRGIKLILSLLMIIKTVCANLAKCLAACRGGTSSIQAFCRTIPDIRIRAACWAVQFASIPACSGFCYLYYTVAGAGADPHFWMWDRVWFQYQGECDLVLLDNPKLLSGSSLKIHIRTKIKSSYSFIDKAAIEIDGEVLEVHSQKEFYLNGKIVGQPPATFARYPMVSINESRWCLKNNCKDAVIQKVDLGTDGYIVITIWKFKISVDITGESGFWNSVGILGIRGKPGKFSRNGTLLFDENIYSEEWQVKDTEPKLFMEERYPQYPDPCIRVPAGGDSKRRIVNNVLRRKAMKACSLVTGGAFDACVYYILATGDVGMGLPYIDL